MKWNQLFSDGRDYAWFPTLSLTKLLSYTKYTYDPNTVRKALDVGCGSGQLARDLFHRGFKVTGIDTSQTAIEIAKQSTHLDDIFFTTHDISKAPLADTFDLITCKYVFAFIDDRTIFLKNIVQALGNNEAYFILISPSPEFTPSDRQAITVDRAETTSLLHHFFSSVSVHQAKGDDWYICSKVRK